MPNLSEYYFFIVQLMAPNCIILREPTKRKGKHRVFG